MRVYAISAVLATLALCAGCPQSGKSGGAGKQSAAVPPPAASPENPAAPPGTPAPISGGAQAAGGNDFMSPENSKAANDNPAAPEQLEMVKKALLAALPAHKLKYDAATDKIMGPPPWDHGVPVQNSLKLIAAKLQKGPGFEQQAVDQAANDFLDQTEKWLNKMMPHGPQGGAPPAGQSGKQGEGETVQVLKNQQPPKLTPAPAVVGEWRSLREVNAGFTTQINHTNLYYETLSVRRDGTLTWTIYRNGTTLSTDDYKWAYDAGSGDFKLTYPAGQDYQTFKVFQADNDPGKIYLRTPNFDRIKVFGPAQ